MPGLPARDVKTTVQYLAEGSTNQRYFSKGIEVNIGTYKDAEVIVKDARPVRDEYTLETSGFQLVEHKSKITDFYDRNQIDNDYTAEIAELVKKMSGADKIVIVSPPVLRQNKEDPGSKYQPRAKDVHTDYSPNGAEMTAVARCNDEPYSRVLFLNIWRPLTPPPQDWPLALIDARTVGLDEGVSYPMLIVDKIPEKLPMDPLPPYTVEGANFVAKPGHDWRYFSDMTTDEVVVFKMYDSDVKKGSKAWRVPHTAFLDNSPGTTVPRESIEVRTICYFK